MSDTKYTLKALEGDLIRGVFLPLGQQIQEVRLHKVESFGVWVESQSFTNVTLKLHAQSAAATTLVIFLPWTEVRLILVEVDTPAISDEIAHAQ